MSRITINSPRWLEKAKELLGVKELDAVADKGFSNGEQVKQCDKADSRAYVAKPHTSRNQQKGLFTKDDFVTTPSGIAIAVGTGRN